MNAAAGGGRGRRKRNKHTYVVRQCLKRIHKVLLVSATLRIYVTCVSPAGDVRNNGHDCSDNVKQTANAHSTQRARSTHLYLSLSLCQPLSSVMRRPAAQTTSGLLVIERHHAKRRGDHGIEIYIVNSVILHFWRIFAPFMSFKLLIPT